MTMRQQLIDAYAWTKTEIGNVPPTAYLFKFLRDIPSMADAALGHVQRLGLDTSPPKRILDLGCATGMLASAMRLYGHEVVATNAPDPVVDIANKYLSVPIQPWTIQLYTLFPREWGTFDLITIHGVNLKTGSTWFTVGDYLWLFRELHCMLNPGGLIDVFQNRGAETDCILNAAHWTENELNATVRDNVLQIRK